MTPLGQGWEDDPQYTVVAYGQETGKLNSTRDVWWHTIFCVNGPQLTYGSIDIGMRTTLVWTRSHMTRLPTMYSPLAVS